MNAVVATPELQIDLKPSREFPRRLHVWRNTRGHIWVGAYPRGKRSICVSYAMGCEAGDTHISEFGSAVVLDGVIALCIRNAQFPISRDEADRLVAAFGFEVKKL